MQRKRRAERDDEPAVTFELDEAPPSRKRNRLGAAGGFAVAGAGLVSSGSAPDSLDVFDHPPEPEGETGDVPVTSFFELGEAEVDPEFPPIDFAEPASLQPDESDTMFGASSEVDGGFVLDDATAGDAFGAVDVEVEAVPDTPVDGGIRAGEDPDLEPDDEDDLDLS